MAILEIRNVTFTYPNRTRPALENISLSLDRGDFAVLCGPTGSGKTTLMKLLKREIRPLGELSGEIFYDGQSLDALDDAVSAFKIGYVCQNTDQQIVTDKVWHELAFGLENLGVESREIRRRVAEMAAFFGIERWFDKRISELSGGQKQLLNLASVMVMQPDILLLDEPTAQLDPIAAGEFIATVAKLNNDLGVSVILIEHRLEEALPISRKVIALKEGRLYAFEETRACCERMRADAEFKPYLPAAVRLYSRFSDAGACPLTVNEGRSYIERTFDNAVDALPETARPAGGNPALEFKNVWFRYARKLDDVLRGLSFTLYENEILCLLGGNGSGKSTLLNCAARVLQPYAGEIRVFGKRVKDYKNQSLYRECLALMPQDVQTVFLRNSVREEMDGVDLKELPFDLSELMDMHPYDLSGGQQQLVALAKVLSLKPKVLMLDEPTKGLDANTKNDFIDIMRALKQGGTSILIVTHDVEFACRVADRCALCFLGEICGEDETNRFFSQNSFYTTAVSRMTRGRYKNLVSVDDAEKLLRLNGRKA
ncbi:MAG: ATP-binding cassette domain-containing protein [Clostridia bacterium]|nr:ATP-binding cassette domain-containing protein [Clostridia bacterium]